MAAFITHSKICDAAMRSEEYVQKRVMPRSSPADLGRFVAVSLTDDDYEISDTELECVSNLLGRHPGADVWVSCIGEPATLRVRRAR